MLTVHVGGIRSLNVALRQELDLYVCLRPVRYFKGLGFIFCKKSYTLITYCCLSPLRSLQM
jgi:isocitrate dehydrogenase